VGTAIVVTLLVLLAVGIVADQLLRLKKWLKRPPSQRR
jgi:HAMP domain-containing protein